MGMVRDMMGKKCGRLTVLARGPDYIEPGNGYHRAQWFCKCSCGNTVLVTGKNLRSGKTKSCGCLVREKGAENGRAHKGVNTYDLSREIGIGFTMKGESFFFDREDYEKIAPYYWFKDHHGYIVTRINGREIQLHRLVMNASVEEKIDHINHQKENACKSNLRRVTSEQNGFNQKRAINNSSGVTGVNYNNQSGKWIARLMKGGISHFLGAYDELDDAIKARKEAEEKYYGEYSYDNSMALSPEVKIA